ncbi:SMR family transporter [Streptomyces sp. NPDC015127]|uniref:SMR family transporter n=1 Tax=Streptomyces sp. NPDC015127 TaxID=3364939 RepID=UPI0036FB0959
MAPKTAASATAGWMPPVALVAVAICVEVGATLSLKVATTRDRRWLALALFGYVGAFAALTGALAQARLSGNRLRHLGGMRRCRYRGRIEVALQ